MCCVHTREAALCCDMVRCVVLHWAHAGQAMLGGCKLSEAELSFVALSYVALR